MPYAANVSERQRQLSTSLSTNTLSQSKIMRSGLIILRFPTRYDHILRCWAITPLLALKLSRAFQRCRCVSSRLPQGAYRARPDRTGTLLPMDREHAICNYVVANDETLVVSDIERDPRFADNETIEQWDVRFYAGAPLRAADGL